MQHFRKLHAKCEKPATTPSTAAIGGTSGGAISPGGRAQSVPIDLGRIKLRQHPNRFQPLAEHNNEDMDEEEDKVWEGSVSDASSSRGNKRREPIPLSAQILLLLDRLEPDKGRQGLLLTEHLA